MPETAGGAEGQELRPGSERNFRITRQRLQHIDYVFHLPLEGVGVVLAFCFLSLFRSYSSGKIVGTAGARTLSEEAAN